MNINVNKVRSYINTTAAYGRARWATGGLFTSAVFPEPLTIGQKATFLPAGLYYKIKDELETIIPTPPTNLLPQFSPVVKNIIGDTRKEEKPPIFLMIGSTARSLFGSNPKDDIFAVLKFLTNANKSEGREIFTLDELYGLYSERYSTPAERNIIEIALDSLIEELRVDKTDEGYKIYHQAHKITDITAELSRDLNRIDNLHSLISLLNSSLRQLFRHVDLYLFNNKTEKEFRIVSRTTGEMASSNYYEWKEAQTTLAELLKRFRSTRSPIFVVDPTEENPYIDNESRENDSRVFSTPDEEFITGLLKTDGDVYGAFVVRNWRLKDDSGPSIHLYSPNDNKRAVNTALASLTTQVAVKISKIVQEKGKTVKEIWEEEEEKIKVQAEVSKPENLGMSTNEPLSPVSVCPDKLKTLMAKERFAANSVIVPLKGRKGSEFYAEKIKSPLSEFTSDIIQNFVSYDDLLSTLIFITKSIYPLVEDADIKKWLDTADILILIRDEEGIQGFVTARFISPEKVDNRSVIFTSGTMILPTAQQKGLMTLGNNLIIKEKLKQNLSLIMKNILRFRWLIHPFGFISETYNLSARVYYVFRTRNPVPFATVAQRGDFRTFPTPASDGSEIVGYPNNNERSIATFLANLFGKNIDPNTFVIDDAFSVNPETTDYGFGEEHYDSRFNNFMKKFCPGNKALLPVSTMSLLFLITQPLREKYRRYKIKKEKIETNGLFKKYFKAYDALNLALPYRKLLSDVTESLEINRGDLVLDAGSGTGNLAIELGKTDAKVVAIDISDNGNIIYRKKSPTASIIKGDLSKPFPFRDSSFDKVASNNVINYLENYEDALKELFRVLKPSGKISISLLKTGFNPLTIYKEHIRQKKSEVGRIRTFFHLLRVLPPTLRIMYYNYKILKKAKAKVYHFFDEEEIRNLFQRVGFRNIEIRNAYANQDLLITAIK
jgi:ubiquinone/menaquinone biosynthesis C-methylase UbiE